MDFGVALADGVAVGSEEGRGGNTEQVVVLWRVGRPLEHVQHSGGDDEPAEHVDEGDEGGGGGQALDNVSRVVTPAHQQKAADGGDTCCNCYKILTIAI